MELCLVKFFLKVFWELGDKMKDKSKIKRDITEKEFIEGLLNMKQIESNVVFPLSLYAFCHQWDLNKFKYYLELLND